MSDKNCGQPLLVDGTRWPDCACACLAWPAYRCKVERGDVPLVVVGGAAALCDASDIRGASMVVQLPEYGHVANAIGAAMPQVKHESYTNHMSCIP